MDGLRWGRPINIHASNAHSFIWYGPNYTRSTTSRFFLSMLLPARHVDQKNLWQRNPQKIKYIETHNDAQYFTTMYPVKHHRVNPLTCTWALFD